MTSVAVTETTQSVVVTEGDGITVVNTPSPAVIVEVFNPGPVRSEDVGVIYLKNNATATPIPTTNARAVVAGTTETGELLNFVKDAGTNSLKYTGSGGKFHIIVMFNFYANSQNTCGFYIGVNKDDTTALDPTADRISESEIYANAGTPSNQPQTAGIQTVCQLDTNDRVFFIVQNKDAATGITVEFMKLIARA